MANVNFIFRTLVGFSTKQFAKSKLSFRNSFLSSPNFTSRKRFYGKTYDSDGKTVAIVINKKSSETITISAVTNFGIVLSSEAELVGAMILFPHSVFSWNVTSAADVNEESLTLFKLLEPKLDILIFGFGVPEDYTPEVRQNFTRICKKLGIRFEALPTKQAAGLFNFFSYEKRFAAAALIPPRSIAPYDFNIKQQKYLDLDEDEDEEEEKSSELQGSGGTRRLLT